MLGNHNSRNRIRNRWAILAGVVALSLLLTACGGAKPKTYTIGVVNYASAMDPVFEGFKAGMAELGYVEGKNVTYIYNGALAPDPQVIDGEIKSLLDQKADLLLTIGTLPAVRAKQAVQGTKIPVIFAPLVNPVGEGLVQSIRQPGGNLTGVQNSITSPKALEWLLKLAPGTKKVHVFYHPEDQVSVTSIAPVREAAPQLGVELVLDEVRTSGEAATVIKTLPKDAAIFIVPVPKLEPVADFVKVATEGGVATGGTNELYVKAGGALVSYAGSLSATGKQAARMADQVLRGTAPATLPVETSEAFLTINLKTAQALGLDVADDLLRQANAVIR